MAGARTSIREQQRELTRARLIEAAAEVFARRGFHAASVEEIAREAGATTGAIYSNFAGKQDLFLAVFEEHLVTQIRDYTETFSRGRNLDERARGGADHWMARVRDDPAFFPLYVEAWAYAVRDPELRPGFAARFVAFRDTFARQVEEGARDMGFELPPGFAERMGIVINALGNGLAMEKLTDPEGVPDELLGWTLSLFFRALTIAARAGEGDLLDESFEGGG
jgi:AcrR family transcriptional regulator